MLKSLTVVFTIVLSGSHALAAGDVCDYVTEYYSEQGSIDSITVREGWVDANNDGKKEFAQLHESGTAHVKDYQFFDEQQNNRTTPLDSENRNQHRLVAAKDSQEEEFRWIGWGNELRWLAYNDQNYLIAYSDYFGKYPSTLWSIDPDFKATKKCNFEVSLNLVSAKPVLEIGKSTDTAILSICKSIATEEEGETLQNIELGNILSLGNETTSKSFMSANITGKKDEKLYLAQYASGRGSGCDAYFYVREQDIGRIKNKDMENLNSLSKALYEAQSVDFSNGGPIASCSKLRPMLKSLNGELFLQKGVSNQKVFSAAEEELNLWQFSEGSLQKACSFVTKLAIKSLKIK